MLRSALARLPQTPLVPMPVATVEFLRRHSVPEDIIRDLEGCSFAAWLPVGPLRLVPMPELEEQTSGVRQCFENGYVVLAGCRNFDPVALDVRTRRMVYVSHELLWDDAREQFEDCICPTPFVYDEFWSEAVSDPAFPCDYYEAKDRWSVPHEGPVLRVFPTPD